MCLPFFSKYLLTPHCAPGPVLGSAGDGMMEGTSMASLPTELTASGEANVKQIGSQIFIESQLGRHKRGTWSEEAGVTCTVGPNRRVEGLVEDDRVFSRWRKSTGHQQLSPLGNSSFGSSCFFLGGRAGQLFHAAHGILAPQTRDRTRSPCIGSMES